MTSPDRHPHTPQNASQDHFLHITVPYQLNNYMCGSYALSYHKLLLEHAQTLFRYPELTPTAFASRLRRELQELLTVSQ
jgi:Ulp1 family protease